MKTRGRDGLRPLEFTPCLFGPVRGWPRFASENGVAFLVGKILMALGNGPKDRLEQLRAGCLGKARGTLTSPLNGSNPQVCEIACRTDVDPKTDASGLWRDFRIRKRKLFSSVDPHSEPPVINFDLQ